MVEYIGRSGYAGGYQVVIGEDRVQVIKEGVVLADLAAPPLDGRSIGRFAAEATDLRLGWGRLPTGDEVVAIFDGERPHLAYVVNLADTALSGWTEPPPLASVGIDEADAAVP